MLFNKVLSLFRLNIPPFVPARTVLEGLEAKDSFENDKPVKSNITHKKVKSPNTYAYIYHWPLAFPNTGFLYLFEKMSNKAKKVKETSDLLRMCHIVPMEVVNLGGFTNVHCLALLNSAILLVLKSEVWYVTYCRWKGLRPGQGRLLWLHGVAAVLLRGRNEVYPGPQRPNYVVQRKLKPYSKSAVHEFLYGTATNSCFKSRGIQAPWFLKVCKPLHFCSVNLDQMYRQTCNIKHAGVFLLMTGSKSVKAKILVKKGSDHDCTDKKKVVNHFVWLEL